MFPNSKNWLLIAPLSLAIGARAQDNGAPPLSPPAPPIATISPAFAGEPEVSVEDLIARALQNNPQLPIARENLEAARQRAGAARGLLNPTLQFVPRLAGNNAAADTEILVSQPLDVFGRRRAQSAVLAAQARGAQAASLLAERSLVVQVKSAAADLFAAQEAENLGVSQVEVAVLFRDAAARRAQLGDVPAVQKQRADLELLRTANELTTARAERLARRAALNQLIGQAPETLLRVALPISSDFTALLQVPGINRPSFSPNLGAGDLGAGTPAANGNLGGNTPNSIGNRGAQSTNLTGNQGAYSPFITPMIGASSQSGADLVAQRGALLPGALSRPDIVGAQATVEARQAQVNAIARGRFPEIELQVRRGSFFGQGQSSTALRAVVTVPLFDFGSIGREKKAAQAEVRAGEAQLALLRQSAATQVEQALIRLQQQRQTVETYRSGIVPQTLDLLRKTQVGYAAGASTYLEVLDAQRTLRAVQTEYLQALVGTRNSEAALESALGAAPPAALVGTLVGALSNPIGAAAPPGTAAPGTVPAGTIPPNPTTPLNPPSSNLPGTNAPLGQGAIPGVDAPQNR